MTATLSEAFIKAPNIVRSQHPLLDVTKSADGEAAR